MKPITRLACQHLDTVIEAGEVDEATARAIRLLFRVIEEEDQDPVEQDPSRKYAEEACERAWELNR